MEIDCTPTRFRVAQCGRTYIHPRHNTTNDWCPGLDGTETRPIPGLLRSLYQAANTPSNPPTT